MLKNIDFGKGIIQYNEFNIDNKVALEKQKWELKEDLIQVKYVYDCNGTYILDVGWYPEFNVNGKFKITIIKNFEWTNPVVLKECNIEKFYTNFNECIEYLNKI